MSTIKTLYGTNGQTLTCTLASLASGSAREATAVDNTSDLFLDILLMLQLKTGAGTIGSDPWAYIYAIGTVDNGNTYTDPATGSDAGITLTKNTKWRLVGQVNLAAASTTYKGGPFSLAAAFGGIVPAKWSIAILNSCGVALSATEGDHKKLYQGVQASVV